MKYLNIHIWPKQGGSKIKIPTFWNRLPIRSAPVMFENSLSVGSSIGFGTKHIYHTWCPGLAAPFHTLTESLNAKNICYSSDKAANSLCLFPHCRDLSLRLVFYAAGLLSGRI